MTDNLLILQTIAIFSLIFSFFSCIFAGFGVYYGVKAWIEAEALKKSTHTVTYEPIDKEIDKANQEWATNNSALEKQRKLFKEDIETEMPEFVEDDDDRQIFSF